MGSRGREGGIHTRRLEATRQRSPAHLPPRSQAHRETEPSGAAPGTGGAAARGHELELLAWGELARCEAAGIIQFLPESSVQAWKLP